ncbi:hypothetical protein AX17_005991 [Amanita inopinata Kibby_2008]|nr:hypothetical protein AX17_005991 [Amanita inopinata Kibby_2008]
MQGWLVFLELYALVIVVYTAPNPRPNPRLQETLEALSIQHTHHTQYGIHLPIFRSLKPRTTFQKRGKAGAIGLGNYMDVIYNVLVTVGETMMPVVLDTGSSDLWFISNACTSGCPSGIPTYRQTTFKSTGLEARLLYGDSSSGTHAFGLIGTDTVAIAGLALPGQYFAAINETNTSVVDTGSAGIFGLGFPVNSVLLNTVFANRYHNVNPTSINRYSPSGRESRSNTYTNGREMGREFPRSDHFNFNKPSFPNMKYLLGLDLFSLSQQDTTFNYQAGKIGTILDDFFASYNTKGPLLSRLVATHALSQPMFSVTIQRSEVEIKGNVGILSIGELPSGVKNESLTWVPLRTYTVDQNGLTAPPDSPNEVYPIAWEVFLDDVYFDGELLPRSKLFSADIQPSALVDTGNSLIRGPADIVDVIYTKVGRNFPCDKPHSLSFSIGGKLFPVDPMDFAQADEDNPSKCSPKLVATDSPTVGGYLYSWSLGDPFLKRWVGPASVILSSTPWRFTAC